MTASASVGPAELLALAVDVAAQASALILDGLGRAHDIDTKASDIDLVTEVDRASEALITELLLAARPDDAIVGEEGASVAGTSGVEWVIDPIDGTTSFVYGLPGFSVSIAARIRGELQAGVVRAPVTGADYRAARGSGTTFDGRTVQASSIDRLDRALVGTGFSPDHARRRRQGAQFAELIGSIRDIRRMGSAALDLAAVAAGQLDAYFEVGLSEWDYAAGVLLVEEAGGATQVTVDPDSGRAFVAASGPHLATAWFELLASLGADEI